MKQNNSLFSFSKGVRSPFANRASFAFHCTMIWFSLADRMFEQNGLLLECTLHLLGLKLRCRMLLAKHQSSFHPFVHSASIGSGKDCISPSANTKTRHG